MRKHLYSILTPFDEINMQHEPFQTNIFHAEFNTNERSSASKTTAARNKKSLWHFCALVFNVSLFFSFSLFCSCFYLHCSRSRITDCLMMFLRWYIEWLYINASVKSLYIYMNTNSHYYYHVKRNNMLHCIHNIHTKISDAFSQWIAQSKIISKMIEEKSMFSAKRFM